MGQPQREPRDDQKRDKDVIRRYEMGSDIDGREVYIHIDGNVLSLHEPGDVEFKKPKFVFVFRDGTDLANFALKIILEVYHAVMIEGTKEKTVESFIESFLNQGEPSL